MNCDEILALVHQVGEVIAVGTGVVTEKLNFNPDTYSCEFDDEDPQYPTCDISEEEICSCTLVRLPGNAIGLKIFWNTRIPRRIKWVADKNCPLPG